MTFPTSPRWHCAACAQPVTENGYLEIDKPGTHWTCWHRECDPNPEAATYWIEVDRIDTWAEVVEWTSHLAEKRWFHDTDWHTVMREALWRTERTTSP